MDDIVREKIVELREQIAELDDNVSELVKKSVEHDTRFSNGRQVMGEMKDDIAKLKPKAPDWLKLAAVALAGVSTLIGGHYWIVTQLNDRPTDVQIEKIMGAHATHGHSATNQDINEIRSVQIEQKVNLSNQAKTLNDQAGILTEHTGKLNTILQRLPRRKSREED